MGPMGPIGVRGAAPVGEAGSALDVLGRRGVGVRGLSLRVASVDEAERSVEATFVTDDPVTVFDWRSYGPIDEVLRIDGGELPEQAPMLNSHMRFSAEDVYGSARGFKRLAHEISGRLFFADGDAAVESAWNKVRQGHISDVSAGYRVLEAVDVKPRTKATVNGTVYQAKDRPLRVVTRWQLVEVSLVPIGADGSAKIREYGGVTAGRETVMRKELREFLEKHCGMRSGLSDAEATAFYNGLAGDLGRRAGVIAGGGVDPGADTSQGGGTAPARSFDSAGDGAGSAQDDGRTAPGQGGSADGSQGQRAAQAGSFDSAADGSRSAQDDGRSAPGRGDGHGNVVDLESVRREAAEAERRRVAQIQEFRGTVSDEIVQRALDEGWDMTRFSNTALQAVRDSRGQAVGAQFSIQSRSHERDATAVAISTGLMERSGVTFERRSAQCRTEAEREALARQYEMAQRFNDMSMLDICREACRLSGVTAPHNRGDMIRAAVTTSSLTQIFTDVMHANLMASYEEGEDTTRDWCEEVEVSDFRPHTGVAIGKMSTLERHARGGQAEHGDIADEGETYQIARYSRQFVVDEQDIIDDRFDALSSIPGEMGEAAARLRPDLVYAHLLSNPTLDVDDVALFHSASHGNYNEGAGTALQASSLKTGVKRMWIQEENGVVLNLKPRVLLVPPDLVFTAQQLVESAEIRESAAANGTKNVLTNLNLTVKGESRLELGVTDPATGTAQTGSATAWYLIARRPRRGMRVAHLRGRNRKPVARSFTLTQGQWGIGFDVNHDIGVKAMGYREFYKAKGAA